MMVAAGVPATFMCGVATHVVIRICSAFHTCQLHMVSISIVGFLHCLIANLQVVVIRGNLGGSLSVCRTEVWAHTDSPKTRLKAEITISTNHHSLHQPRFFHFFWLYGRSSFRMPYSYLIVQSAFPPNYTRTGSVRVRGQPPPPVWSVLKGSIEHSIRYTNKDTHLAAVYDFIKNRLSLLHILGKNAAKGHNATICTPRGPNRPRNKEATGRWRQETLQV